LTEEQKERKRVWASKHPRTVTEEQKQCYRERYRERRRKKALRQYYAKRDDPVFKEYSREKARAWAKANPEANRARANAWGKANRERYRQRMKIWKPAYRKQKRQTDPVYRIVERLRRRIREAFKGIRKSTSTWKLIGCDLDWLLAWLEVQLKSGMTWENYGSVWHIDHVRPFASFPDLTDPAQQRLCCHWTNLQPLFAAENISKHANWEAA
jgi:hypothetical protein